MFDAPAFLFGGSTDSAHAAAPARRARDYGARGEIVEALIGVRLGPRARSPCSRVASREADAITAARAYGPLGAITIDDGRVFLERRDGLGGHGGLIAGLIVGYQ